MHIITPTEIEAVAWEGELVAPAISYRGLTPRSLVATVGRPEIFPVDKALENEVGRKWTPPLGGADFWLVRLACTLREPGGHENIVEATETLYLRPKNPAAGADAVYAFSLFPDRLGIESKAEFSVGLGPELKFGAAVDLKAGELGAKIEYRKVFPVIQGYGAGESAPAWVFKPHAAFPLAGSQFVYAVVAAKTGANGVRASVALVATVNTQLGPVRLGLPEDASAHVSFTIP